MGITPEHLLSLRTIAISEANEQTYLARYKSLCRWYSREFHTPLAQVEEMPEEVIFRTWYEDTFWRLKTGSEAEQKTLQDLITDILAETDPEFKQAAIQAEEDDDEWYENELKQLEQQLAEKPNKINSSEYFQEENEEIVNPNLNEDLADIMDELSDQE